MSLLEVDPQAVHPHRRTQPSPNRSDGDNCEPRRPRPRRRLPLHPARGFLPAAIHANIARIAAPIEVGLVYTAPVGVQSPGLRSGSPAGRERRRRGKRSVQRPICFVSPLFFRSSCRVLAPQLTFNGLVETLVRRVDSAAGRIRRHVQKLRWQTEFRRSKQSQHVMRAAVADNRGGRAGTDRLSYVSFAPPPTRPTTPSDSRRGRTLACSPSRTRSRRRGPASRGGTRGRPRGSGRLRRRTPRHRTRRSRRR